MHETKFPAPRIKIRAPSRGERCVLGDQEKLAPHQHGMPEEDDDPVQVVEERDRHVKQRSSGPVVKKATMASFEPSTIRCEGSSGCIARERNAGLIFLVLQKKV